MATFITKRCAYLSYVVVLYGVYFFLIVPLVWGRAKPNIFVKGSNDQYHLIFWCTALLLFLVIILGSWLARKCCCWSRLKNDAGDYETGEHSRLIAQPATLQPSIGHSVNTGASGPIPIVNEKVNFLEDRESENDEVFYRSAECLETIRSSDMATQTESPLTPREKFFHDLFTDDVETSGINSIDKRRTSVLSSTGHRYEPIILQNSRRPSLLMPMDELTKHNRDLSAFMKRLNSQNQDSSIIDVTREFLEREQKKTTDFLKLSSRGYLIRLQSTKSPRSTLKSEIHIDIGG